MISNLNPKIQALLDMLKTSIADSLKSSIGSHQVPPKVSNVEENRITYQRNFDEQYGPGIVKVSVDPSGSLVCHFAPPLSYFTVAVPASK